MNQEQRNKKAEQLRIAARIVETGCGWEARGSAEWFGPLETSPVHAIQNGWEIRIKEPVIPVPEGWRELRDDEKTGDFIQGARYLSGTKEWDSLTSGCYAYKPQRIIVPTSKPKKRVPLGPEDVVPGSVVRAIGDARFRADLPGEWAMILNTDSDRGISVVSASFGVIWLGWDNLQKAAQIKRPTDTEWQGCWKLEVEP